MLLKNFQCNGREWLCRQLQKAGIGFTRRERPEGLPMRHRVNANSVKMYHKQGSVLRIETTINDAHDLSVYRASESDPKGKKKWQRLRKGVADLPRRAAISQAANRP